MTRVRTLLFTVVSCTVWLACTEGVGPSAHGGTAGLAVVPRFQIDPALFADAPIDRIVLTAYETSTERPVGSADQAVSPTANEWALRLAIDLGDAEFLQVFVDAELYSGPTVAWSGRLGPIRVPNAAPALGMDVYPGSLDNLDVTSVTIEGAPSVLVEGASTDLTASLTLIPGSSAEPVVYWASTDESVATVTSTGPTATLTAVSPGTVEILATSGAAYDEVTVEVIEVGAVTKTWVGGAGSGDPTAWSNPANWSPPGVPGASDAVLVPSAASDPVLSADASVGSIRLGNSGSVDLGGHVLSVTNDLDAELGEMFNGSVRVTGPGTELSGALPNLEILSNRALSGGLYLSGDLLLSGKELDTDVWFVTVLGTLSVSGDGARLVMTDPETSIYAEGGMVFDGASHDGFLTGGYISAAGDFTVTGRSPTGFAASGTHVVSFDDINPQSVTFATPGASQQRLNDVWVNNSAGVSFDTDAVAAGDVMLTGRMEVPQGSTVSIAGDLTLYSLSELNVEGTLEVLGACDAQVGAVITGAGTIPEACGGATSVDRTWTGASSQDWSEPDNWTPPGVPGATDAVLIPGGTPLPVLTESTAVGHLTIAGGTSIDLATFTLSVAGDVSTGFGGADNGLVHITGPGSILEGVFDDLRVSADRALSDLVNVYGDLAIEGALDTNGHDVTVLGSLDVNGPGAVLRETSPSAYVYVWGNATFNGGDHSNALTDGYFSVKGAFLATDASPGSYVSSGNHTTVFDGGESQAAVFEIPGGGSQRLNHVIVSNPVDLLFDSNVYATGDVDVHGHLTVPAGRTTTIEGELTLYSASLFEVESGATVTAAGGCTDLGGIILGDGAQPCGTPVPADYHWTGASSATWSEPDNWEPVGVPGPSDAVLVLDAPNEPVLFQNVSLSALTVQQGAIVDLNGYVLTVSGDLAVDGYLENGLTEVTGAGTELRGSVGSLLITAPRAQTGLLDVKGDLTVRHSLALSSDFTYVGGDFTVETDTGELIMDQSSGYLFVFGNATFDGTSLEGDLTGGIIYLGGDLTVLDTNDPDYAFTATGTAVYMFGTNDQAIYFSNPGGDVGQSFGDLLIGNDGGVVTFESDAFVTGDLASSLQQTLVGSGSTTLEVNGDVSVSDVTFNGLMFRMVGNVSAGTHTLANLTFTGMPDDVVQLYVEVPGGGSSDPLVLTAPQFLSPPAAGYYVQAVDNGVDPQSALWVTLTGPTPQTATKSVDYLTTGQAEIVWGP